MRVWLCCQRKSSLHSVRMCWTGKASSGRWHLPLCWAGSCRLAEPALQWGLQLDCAAARMGTEHAPDLYAQIDDLTFVMSQEEIDQVQNAILTN